MARIKRNHIKPHKTFWCLVVDMLLFGRGWAVMGRSGSFFVLLSSPYCTCSPDAVIESGWRQASSGESLVCYVLKLIPCENNYSDSSPSTSEEQLITQQMFSLMVTLPVEQEVNCGQESGKRSQRVTMGMGRGMRISGFFWAGRALLTLT